MERDTLKHRVGAERNEFEIYQIDTDELGSEIDKDLSKTKRLSVMRVIGRIAAVLVVGLGITWLASLYTSDPYSNGVSLSDLSPELAETEFFYLQQVSEKLQLIQASDYGIDPEIMGDLAVLDSAYQQLKMDLKDNIDNEEVVNAMITNYRIRLQLLEQILIEIQEHDNEEDNKVSI